MGKRKTLANIVLASGIVGGLAFGISSCMRWENNYIVSEGSKVGLINRFSKQNLIWETYEGTLALQGLSDQGANLWAFSIDKQARNDENVEKLIEDTQRYLDSQELVKITYRKPFSVFPWRASAPYLIQKVEPIRLDNH